MSATLRHYANSFFWKTYEKLPEEVKKIANKNFELLKKDPYHPFLHLKKVGKYWSVRIGKKYRAIGIQVEKAVVWFWIGKHSDYEDIIKS